MNEWKVSPSLGNSVILAKVSYNVIFFKAFHTLWDTVQSKLLSWYYAPEFLCHLQRQYGMHYWFSMISVYESYFFSEFEWFFVYYPKIILKKKCLSHIQLDV